ncbi:unnamed protein product [Discosporangium mesarthrocarpum]
MPGSGEEELTNLGMTSQAPSNSLEVDTQAPAIGLNAKQRRALRRAALVARGPEEVRDSSGNTIDENVKSHKDLQRVAERGSEVDNMVESCSNNGLSAEQRRAAQAATTNCIQDWAGDTQPKKVPSATPAGETPNLRDSTAKERRLARRMAAREAAASAAMFPETKGVPNGMEEIEGTPATAVKSATPLPSGTEPGGTTSLTSKQRRLARRAAERAAAEQGSGASTAVVAANTAPDSGAVKGLKAKERRLAKRAEERKRSREAEGGVNGGAGDHQRVSKKRKAAATPAMGAGAGVGNGGKTVPHIVFVGQLAFSTTAKGLEEHFKSKGGVEGKMSVRLLTIKGTNPPRSKGMAFVEVGNAITAYKCLALHHTRLDGRLINVERTSGGGKGCKSERIKEKRVEQKELMKELVSRVLKEAVKAGRLGEGELDTEAVGVLEKMEGKVGEWRALQFKRQGTVLDRPVLYMYFP